MSKLNADAKEFVPRSTSRPSSTIPSQTPAPIPVATSSLSNRLYQIRNDGPCQTVSSEISSAFRPLPIHRHHVPQVLQSTPFVGSSHDHSNFSYTHSNNNHYQAPFPALSHHQQHQPQQQQQPSNYVNETNTNISVQQQSSHIDFACVQEELKKIEAERKALKDFESLIKILVETPAEFESACEYIVYLISPHLKNRDFMRQLVMILVSVAWDVNFHYSAALLSKKLDIISPVFKEELFDAIDNEINREISNLVSMSLFVSELFYVFKPDIFPQFYRCLNLLINNTNSNDNVKTACKLLKLNGYMLFKQYPHEYTSAVLQLRDQRPNFTEDIRQFVDRTLAMIESIISQAEAESDNGQSAGGGDAANASNVSQQQQSVPSQQSQQHQQQLFNQNDSFFSFLTNAGENDLVGALNVNHDSGMGGVFYGPDQKPLTQEELNFLSVSDEMSSQLDDYIQREIHTVIEDDLPPTDTDQDYMPPN